MHPRKESVQQKKIQILYSLGKQKVQALPHTLLRQPQPTIKTTGRQQQQNLTKWHHQWNTAYHIHIPSWFDHGEDDDNGWPRRSIILLGKKMTKKTQCTAIIHDDGHHGLYNPKYCRPATTTATEITTMIGRWQLHTGGYSECKWWSWGSWFARVITPVPKQTSSARYYPTTATSSITQKSSSGTASGSTHPW